MQTVYLITTGGTIEKEYSEQLGVVLNNTSKVGEYLKRLRLPDCNVQIVPLMNKDSLDMTQEDRGALVSAVKERLSSHCPMVITHGTDTLVESGRWIERSIPGLAVPIVLTGAMKPLGFDRSDGLQNLTESLLAAQLLGAGVYVVFHGRAFPASRARKDLALGTFVALDETAPPLDFEVRHGGLLND